MAGLHLFTSNRMEKLAARLAERLRRPLRSPLAPEFVVVRHKGMERWLQQQLAARLGVWANGAFVSPEDFVALAAAEVVGAEAGETGFDAGVWAWRVAQALPELVSREEFAPVRHYLADDPEQRKLVQLAGRVARLFEQYRVYRPELVRAWSAGRVGAAEAEDWQATLWRRVTAGLPRGQTTGVWEEFDRRVAQAAAAGGVLPERVCIFGVSAMAPLHLGVLAALPARMEVNLFLLQPCAEYWGEITSAREEERMSRRRSPPEAAPFALHLEQGNRLLASLGYLGRDFLKLVLDAGEWETHEDFVEPGEGSLLHGIQSDILCLRDRGRDGSPRGVAAADDDSVQVHSCHSPLRELEVLHDHLLEWFRRDPTLAPRDVVVMTPDLETYAPFVEAVFAAPEEERRRIPFTLADRGPRGASHLVEVFFQLLDLRESRLGAAAVMGLLETAAVRARFGIEERDLELIRHWLEETNIRWGMDAAHRARLGLPALAQNTWREGLDRLLLGYALAARDFREAPGGTGARPPSGPLFAGLLPFEDLEGEGAVVLGRLVEFVERLFATAMDLEKLRPLTEWADTLLTLLEDFFQPEEEGALELQAVRHALTELRRGGREAGFTASVSLAAVVEVLAPELAEERAGAGYLNGAVTFCGLKPMRSVPFRIVCLVGMNDSSFPRLAAHLSFDWMARRPRLGDRSTREDDRYLFLETLLSARERLYLSYAGQGIRDNKEAPPSVLVSELLDYVEQGFEGMATTGTPGDCLRERLVRKHRLQAFHPDYFTENAASHPRFFSFSTDNSLASRSARSGRRPPGAFVSARLPEPEAEFRRLTVEDLAGFFANPARFFLHRRLRIFLRTDDADVEERERFVLEGLDGYRLREELVEAKQRGDSESAAAAWAGATGQLPLGRVGAADYQRTAAQVGRFWRELERFRPAELQPPIEVDLAVGQFHLTGRVGPVTPTGLLRQRCARLRGRDVARAWVCHLLANATRPGTVTTLAGLEEVRQFRPCGEALVLLNALLELYWQGLASPLKFFPESALAFVETERRRATNARIRVQPLNEATKAWRGDAFRRMPGERDDENVELCFRGSEPLDEEFTALARSILGPALHHEVVL